MSIIERRPMSAIRFYCAMTIINLSAGMQFATAQALIGAAAPAFTLTDSNDLTLSLADFKGGIDDQATARLQDLKSARNFVDQALSEISQGKPVSVTTSRAYGCSIKYGP